MLNLTASVTTEFKSVLQITPSHLPSASVLSTFSSFGSSHQKRGMGRAVQGQKMGGGEGGHGLGKAEVENRSVWVDRGPNKYIYRIGTSDHFFLLFWRIVSQSN
jgi:hypothetical protein